MKVRVHQNLDWQARDLARQLGKTNGLEHVRGFRSVTGFQALAVFVAGAGAALTHALLLLVAVYGALG